MMEKIFMDSVEQAIALSMKEEKVLVVYNTSGDDRWLESWFKTELTGKIKPYGVWLRLVKGTEQFRYFEALFPSVAIPSLYLIKQGKVLTIIKNENGVHRGQPSHWENLGSALGAPLGVYTGKTSSSKTLREQIEETSQQKYHEELIKQRKKDQEERARILRLVEADKAERKARQRATEKEDVLKEADIHDNIKDLSKLITKDCTLLIRQTDGNTLTRQFDPKSTLNDVRRWIDSNRTDGDCPYSFHRNIPRATFTDSDELKSLADLELLPRSALILKPFDVTTERMNIANAKGPGLLGKVFGGISNWWTNGNNENGNAEDSYLTDLRQTQSAHPSEQLNESHLDNQSEKDSKLTASAEQSSIAADISSNQVTPAQTASDSHIKHNISELSLPSRCVTPNVHQFVNKDDNDKEPSMYNGNNINLGKKADDE